MTGSIGRRIDALADRLAATGDLTDPRWRDAMHAAPRHLFVPDVAWATPYDGDGYRIDRAASPDAWMAAAYANHPIIIQLADGAADVGTGQGAYTSSLSAPDVVMAFLHLLDPYDGDRVLEIGTGSGWTAGLLSARVGDGNVTSVEVDPQVADAAATALKAAGFTPHLITGDGADGCPENAPFDRVHVTCGVTAIPHAWVAQTRPGGVIVLPWMPEYEDGHKLVLTAVGDGSAVGRLHGSAGYMMLRSQRSAWVTRGDAGDWRESDARMDPRRLVCTSWGADAAIAGMLPDVSSRHHVEGDGTFVLFLQAAGSEAEVWWPVEPAGRLVRQRGSRDLWTEVTCAFQRWVGWGSPGQDRFGMTVTREGQRVWLDSPANPLPLSGA